MAGYFGDLRDTFDELYPTSASFVRLLGKTPCKGPHVTFNLDLTQEQAADYFRMICYAYEDSFDWSLLPLLFDPENPVDIVRWRFGERVVFELPIRLALREFDRRCHGLLDLK